MSLSIFGKVRESRAIKHLETDMKLLRVIAATSPPARGVATDTLPAGDAFYGQHLAKVKRWARRLAGPSADLEDLLHDVFLVALQKGFQDRGEAHVDTWLFGITQRVVWSRRRKARVRAWLFGRNQTVLVGPLPYTPQHELERREQTARLYAALERLSDVHRTTLILYELEELSGEDVARLMGVSVGTVWVRLHRGREKLMQILGRGERA